VDNGVANLANLKGNVALDLNINVKGDGAANIDEATLTASTKDIVYEGIYQLFSDYKKGLN
jgi:hypothetical protein